MWLGKRLSSFIEAWKKIHERMRASPKTGEGDPVRTAARMELIMISDSKLKVMLSADDMRNYEFDDINNIHTKEAFRNLMREAKNRCGFNALEGRVFVQLYRSKAGGCELFVTKLSKSDDGESASAGKDPADKGILDSSSEKRAREERTAAEYRQYYAERKGNGRHVIYSFDNMQNLLSTCGVLLASRYKGESVAYMERGKRRFYLALEEETFAAGEHFGKLCPSSFYYYINEHCALICGEAVPLLGGLA